jgi:HlyD family secretion protein
MSKKTIIIISLIIVAAIIALYCWFHFNTKTNEYYWRTVKVEKGDVTVMITATGTMNADTSVDVGTQVTGTIAKIKVDFNSMVKKGQVLAILDTALLSASKIDAEATLKRAELQLEQSKRDYDRAKKLFDNNITAPAEYDPILTLYQTAQSTLISAQAQLSRAKINLQFATIKAPISGMVIARNIQVGNMVIASFNSPTLFTIVNSLTKMQLQVNVDEADIGQVTVGQNVKFTVNAYPSEIFTGKVIQVRQQPVIVQSVVNYVVIVEVFNRDMKLLPGLTANLNIYIQEQKSVLKVPAGAFSFTPPLDYIKTALLLPDSLKKQWEVKLHIRSEIKKQQIVESDSSTAYVWLKRGKDIYPIHVVKGLSDGLFTEVHGNIQEGDDVVTGINLSPTASDTKSTQNPFVPKLPSRKR